MTRVVWKVVKRWKGRQTDDLPPLSNMERSASNFTALTLSQCPSRTKLEISSWKIFLGKAWWLELDSSTYSGIRHVERCVEESGEILYFDRQLRAVPRSTLLIVN